MIGSFRLIPSVLFLTKTSSRHPTLSWCRRARAHRQAFNLGSWSCLDVRKPFGSSGLICLGYENLWGWPWARSRKGVSFSPGARALRCSFYLRPHAARRYFACHEHKASKEHASVSEEAGWLNAMRSHPIITGVNASCVVLGLIGAFLMAPEDWSLVRTFFAGCLSGGFIGICITAPRMVGQ